MDYKYIDQLLERYWKGETSLEQEQILRSFFSQKSVPEQLRKYIDLFTYEQSEPKTDVLGKDFDERVMAMIAEPPTVKARIVTLKQRLAPLYKAAAVVAIILTLSNAAQISFHEDGYENVTSVETPSVGRSVALTDSTKTDTVRHTMINAGETTIPAMYK